MPRPAAWFRLRGIATVTIGGGTMTTAGMTVGGTTTAGTATITAGIITTIIAGGDR